MSRRWRQEITPHDFIGKELQFPTGRPRIFIKAVVLGPKRDGSPEVYRGKFTTPEGRVVMFASHWRKLCIPPDVHDVELYVRPPIEETE